MFGISLERLWRWLPGAIGVCAAGLVVFALTDRLGELHASDFAIRPGYLALATGCIAIAVTGFGLVWTYIVNQLTDRSRGISLSLFKAFAYSWLARYLPGTVPYVVMRIELAQRQGYGRPTVAASLAYENALQIGTALLISIVLLLLAMRDQLDGYVTYAVALAPMLGLLVLVWPRVLVPTMNFIFRLLGRSEIREDALLSAPAVAGCVISYAVLVLINGLGFYAALNALAPTGPEHIPAAIGVYNLAGVLGILAVVMPSGLGVREGIITGLVSLQFPFEVAAGVAIISRVAAVAADALPAAATVVLDNLPGRR